MKYYFISCSKASKFGVLKNAPSVMPSPSHSILIVISFGFLLFPYRMFFTEDGGSALRLASLFIVMFLSAQSCWILFWTVCIIFSMYRTPLFFSLGYPKAIDNVGYTCYY